MIGNMTSGLSVTTRSDNRLTIVFHYPLDQWMVWSITSVIVINVAVSFQLTYH